MTNHDQIPDDQMTTFDVRDVVVIGGGPAGSTVSTLLAQQGLQVELFERDRFPRFHIGESLIPETYWVLKRLNMLPKMQQSHFVKKYSVQFVNASGKLSAPFYFWDNKPHECSQTWQVVRSEFDQMMLENAREHGVVAHEGVRVLDLLWEDERAVGVTIRQEDGKMRDVRAKVVVDASGQAGLIQNKLRLRVWDPMLNKGAIWTYWEGAYRDTGRDEGATMVLQTASKNGWFWYIPQHNNIVSVGVVAPFDYLFKNRDTPGDYERTYSEEVNACAAVKERVASGPPRRRLFRDQRLFVPRHPGGGRRLGDDWRRVGISGSALFLGRAAGAAIRRDGRRRDRRGVGEGRHVGGAARQMGTGVQRRRRPDAAAGLRVLRRLQLRQFREALSGVARHGHRPADRRSVHRSRGQGVEADGIALSAGQIADSGVERQPGFGRRGDESQRTEAAGRLEALTQVRYVGSG